MLSTNYKNHTNFCIPSFLSLSVYNSSTDLGWEGGPMKEHRKQDIKKNKSFKTFRDISLKIYLSG